MKATAHNNLLKLFVLLLVLHTASAHLADAAKPDKEDKETGKPDETDKLDTPEDTGSSDKPGKKEATPIGVDATKANPKKVHFKNGWNVSGDYTVVGPTILVIDGDFDIGNNTINIAPTGSLEIYVSGNIDVSGNGGINNQGVPANFLAFGTHPKLDENDSPAHSWTLSGNGALTGVVYAPNETYRENGGGSRGYTSGSVVAQDIRFNGNTAFHFDEALRDLILPFGGYSLSDYELLRNGSNGKSDSAATVFGSTDYAALFKQLYP